MSCGKIQEQSPRMYKADLNCCKTCVSAIVSALTAIGLVTGVLIILTTQGINLGALNVLSNVGLIGGIVMTSACGIIWLISCACLVSKLGNSQEELRRQRLLDDARSLY